MYMLDACGLVAAGLRVGLTGTATGESSKMHRPASPHFVTECKNRGMMRRTKYVVVHLFFQATRLNVHLAKLTQ